MKSKELMNLQAVYHFKFFATEARISTEYYNIRIPCFRGIIKKQTDHY
jgi:hypothetical protein